MRMSETISQQSITSPSEVRCPSTSSPLQVHLSTFGDNIIAQSRSLAEAHMKSLRLFRKYCRYMPFIIHWNGFRKFTNPEKAKLQLARHWRQGNRVRDIDNIDNFVKGGYERLYNIQQGDVWGNLILGIYFSFFYFKNLFNLFVSFLIYVGRPNCTCIS